MEFRTTGTLGSLLLTVDPFVTYNNRVCVLYLQGFVGRGDENARNARRDRVEPIVKARSFRPIPFFTLPFVLLLCLRRLFLRFISNALHFDYVVVVVVEISRPCNFLRGARYLREGCREKRRSRYSSFIVIFRFDFEMREDRAERGLVWPPRANDRDDRFVSNENSVVIVRRAPFVFFFIFLFILFHFLPCPRVASRRSETKKRKKYREKRAVRGAARYLAVYGYQKDIWLLIILVILSPCKCCIYIFTLFIIIREHGNK